MSNKQYYYRIKRWVGASGASHFVVQRRKFRLFPWLQVNDGITDFVSVDDARNFAIAYAKKGSDPEITYLGVLP